MGPSHPPFDVDATLQPTRHIHTGIFCQECQRSRRKCLAGLETGVEANLFSGSIHSFTLQHSQCNIAEETEEGKTDKQPAFACAKAKRGNAEKNH